MRVDYFQIGKTINSDYYSNFLEQVNIKIFEKKIMVYFRKNNPVRCLDHYASPSTKNNPENQRIKARIFVISSLFTRDLWFGLFLHHEKFLRRKRFSYNEKV